MSLSVFIQTIFLTGVFAFTSCNNTGSNGNNEIKSDNKVPAIKTETSQLSPDFLGIYHGIQPSYIIKNRFGDNMIINGKTVSLPSIDFKFLLKDNSMVSLQQTNLEDNDRVYYEGKFKIIKDTTDAVQIECVLSNGQSSNPTYY